MREHIVMVGGGFGGLEAARHLSRAPADVTLIDRQNYHLFQPLLYQVGMGQLSPANIAAPLRSIFRRQPNVQVRLGEAIDVLVAERRLILRDGEISYDTLIVAAGARHHYFGHPEWQPLAPGLKTIEDATAIRRRVLLSFERAEQTRDPAERKAHLTFIVVGGGPTGVEHAGTLADLARHTLRDEFRNFDSRDAEVLIIEGSPRRGSC